MVTVPRSSGSRSLTVFLADASMTEGHLSNHSVPERYMCSSQLNPCSMRRVRGLHRLSPNRCPRVSRGLFKVLCFAFSSSPPTSSFLVIFPFGKENSTISESSCRTRPHRMPYLPARTPHPCFSSSLTANFSRHVGGIWDPESDALWPHNASPGLRGPQVFYSVCSCSYGFS